MTTTMFMPDDLIPTIYSYIKPTPEQHRIWLYKKNREAIVNNWKDEELDGSGVIIKMYMVNYIASEFLEECDDPEDGVYDITTEQGVEYVFSARYNPWLYEEIIDEDSISFKDIDYLEEFLHDEGLINDNNHFLKIDVKINMVLHILATRLWYQIEEAEEQLEPVNVNE